MNNTARLYNCARCHCQVIVCSHCDRGNIYCRSLCARKSRIQNHRIANQIYQKTFRGKQKHALRQSHYRLRQKNKIKKVTDQGSLKTPPNDLLPSTKNEWKEVLHCHFCRRNISPYLRNGYLRYHIQHIAKQKNKLFHFNDTG